MEFRLSTKETVKLRSTRRRWLARQEGGTQQIVHGIMSIHLSSCDLSLSLHNTTGTLHRHRQASVETERLSRSVPLLLHTCNANFRCYGTNLDPC